jgi:hypothetical protein
LTVHDLFRKTGIHYFRIKPLNNSSGLSVIDRLVLPRKGRIPKACWRWYSGIAAPDHAIG